MRHQARNASSPIASMTGAVYVAWQRMVANKGTPDCGLSAAATVGGFAVVFSVVAGIGMRAGFRR